VRALRGLNGGTGIGATVVGALGIDRVREDHLGGFLWCDIGVQGADGADRDHAAGELGDDVGGNRPGSDPGERVREHPADADRRVGEAGGAVKKYAAPIYAPTAAGAAAPRRVRASEKMTSSRPRVAITSANRCDGLARCLGKRRDKPARSRR
jgi:hypothetical protein